MKIHGNNSEISNEFLGDYFERNFRISKNASAKSAVRAQLTITKRATALTGTICNFYKMQFYGRWKEEKTFLKRGKKSRATVLNKYEIHHGIIQSCLPLLLVQSNLIMHVLGHSYLSILHHFYTKHSFTYKMHIWTLERGFQLAVIAVLARLLSVRLDSSSITTTESETWPTCTWLAP